MRRQRRRVIDFDRDSGVRRHPALIAPAQVASRERTLMRRAVSELGASLRRLMADAFARHLAVVDRPCTASPRSTGRHLLAESRSGEDTADTEQRDRFRQRVRNSAKPLDLFISVRRKATYSRAYEPWTAIRETRVGAILHRRKSRSRARRRRIRRRRDPAHFSPTRQALPAVAEPLLRFAQHATAPRDCSSCSSRSRRCLGEECYGDVVGERYPRSCKQT